MKKRDPFPVFRLFNRFRCGLVLMFVLPVLLVGCDRSSEPVKIGYVGGLSGRLSDLGTAGRDGAQLAVEMANQEGGVNGRPIELLIRNDQQDPTVVARVDQELIDAGVIAIIGPMTSSMSLASLPVINAGKTVMISPTASTKNLSGIDDYFFRLTPENSTEIAHLVGYLQEKTSIRKIAVVYDISNRQFSEGWYHRFKIEAEAVGIDIQNSVYFKSNEKPSFSRIVKRLIRGNAQGMLIIAGAIDAAAICQQVRKLGLTFPIISSGWAQSEEFIQYGGRAVNGVVFSHTYDKTSQNERFLRFKKRFSEQFNKEPDFGSAHAFEAGQIILDAFSRKKNNQSLKEAILGRHVYPGLMGDIIMGANGDVERKRFLITVKNGQFVSLK